MPKAFICGCSGLTLTAEERAFLRESDPWGLILFKRNVADCDQLRALTRSFR
jgi:beta-N-acetylhexosaminidase